MDSLPQFADLNGVTVVGVCVFVMIAIAFGWLVTKREHEDVKRQRDRALDALQTNTETNETILYLLRAIRYGDGTHSGDDEP